MFCLDVNIFSEFFMSLLRCSFQSWECWWQPKLGSTEHLILPWMSSCQYVNQLGMVASGDNSHQTDVVVHLDTALRTVSSKAVSLPPSSC